MKFTVTALFRVKDEHARPVTRWLDESAQGGAERVRPRGWSADFQPIGYFHRHFIRTANTFRRSLIHLACLPLMGLIAALPATANTAPPKNIRVCVQYIEMPHTYMTELLSGKAQPGHVLHEMAMAMTKEGKAKVVESGVVVVRGRSKATVATIREVIYPTEYSPPTLPCPTPRPRPRPDPPDPPQPRPPFMNPTAFETRDAGFSLEVKPTVDESMDQIELCIVPEMVHPSKIGTMKSYQDQWGDASVRMPNFETWRTNTLMTIPPGKFHLVTTITPKPTEPVPATLRKILVFVRCDVIAVGKP